MKKTYIHIITFVICLLAWSAASATILKNLYEVGVPVITQDAKERKQAIKQAFEILLVRVTGKRDLPQTATGQLMIKNARRYVSSFRYEILELPPVEQTPPEETETVNDADQPELDQVEPPVQTDQSEEVIDQAPTPTQKLVVTFDEKAVKNTLWKQKLPVWGKTRPSTLLWVAVQDEEQRILLDASEPTALLSYFEKQAEKRGVPILFPLLDLEDQININVTDVWGAFKEPIKNASLRYQPEAILTARLFLDPFGSWQARWTLYQGSDEIDWQVNAADLESVVIAGLDQLADRLAQRYAHVSSVQDDSEFLIYITDVKSLADYVRVSKYLNGLATIKRAELVQVKGDELVYRLDLRSSPQALKQAIKLGKVLLTAEDPFAPEMSTLSRLNYRLMP